jgi:voltage-gated potassium channel
LTSGKRSKKALRKQIITLIRENLLPPVIIFLTVYTVGIIGYYLIGYLENTPKSILHCFYQVGILLTAVGFTDILKSHESVAASIFTVFLSLFGIGFLLWMLSTVTGFIVSGKLLSVLGREKMRKKITALKNHFIICGGGETGIHCVEELCSSGTDFVLIDINEEIIDDYQNKHKDILFLKEDASEDDVLVDAGIHSAAGLVAALSNDKDNLLLTITARQLNPEIRIVSRAVDLTNIQKLKKAGADAVVCPTRIGGLRMISEMLRPTVTNFLDTMMSDRRMIRIEEAIVEAGSKLAGLTLAEANISAVSDVNVIATRLSNDDDFTYNPRGNTKLDEGTTLVVLGPSDDITKLKKLITA